VVDGWAADGDAGRIADLVGTILEEQDQLRDRGRMLDEQLRYALRVLALTPGRHFMQQLLRARPPSPRAPLLASMIAHAQPLEHALWVLGQGDDKANDVLGGCLFHELLLRGTDPRVLGAAYRRSMPSWLSPDDLSWLPRTLSELEHAAHFPSYTYRTGAGFGAAQDMTAPFPVSAEARRAGAAHPVRQTGSADRTALLTGPPAKGGWINHEGRSFVADHPIPQEAVPGVLAALPLDCLEGLETQGDPPHFEVSESSASEVWSILYDIGAGGGVGTNGLLAAYGRLAAWKSLCILAGANRYATCAQVEQQARACTWFRFETNAEWFCNDLMSDFGIAALTPDGRVLTVLAATDTD
jgi:hypothetical protein